MADQKGKIREPLMDNALRAPVDKTLPMFRRFNLVAEITSLSREILRRYGARGPGFTGQPQDLPYVQAMRVTTGLENSDPGDAPAAGNGRARPDACAVFSETFDQGPVQPAREHQEKEMIPRAVPVPHAVESASGHRVPGIVQRLVKPAMSTHLAGEKARVSRTALPGASSVIQRRCLPGMKTGAGSFTPAAGVQGPPDLATQSGTLTDGPSGSAVPGTPWPGIAVQEAGICRPSPAGVSDHAVVMTWLQKEKDGSGSPEQTAALPHRHPLDDQAKAARDSMAVKPVYSDEQNVMIPTGTLKNGTVDDLEKPVRREAEREGLTFVQTNVRASFSGRGGEDAGAGAFQIKALGEAERAFPLVRPTPMNPGVKRAHSYFSPVQRVIPVRNAGGAPVAMDSPGNSADPRAGFSDQGPAGDHLSRPMGITWQRNGERVSRQVLSASGKMIQRSGTEPVHCPERAGPLDQMTILPMPLYMPPGRGIEIIHRTGPQVSRSTGGTATGSSVQQQTTPSPLSAETAPAQPLSAPDMGQCPGGMEAVADQVYALIMERLAVERESLGL